MKKKIVIILFSFFFALSVQQLSACCCGNEQFQAYQFEGMVGASFLETAEPYNGDRSGRFVGDPLATLSDGSQWKVHPDNKKRFFDWQQGDKVYILPRTSFYWFKREHKFKMYNATKDQYIKVMFIRYPSHARYIQAAEKFLADSRYEPYEYFDAQGHRQVRYHRVETYYKNIRLDDGTVLTIKDSSKFEDFRIGMKVYVGIAPGAHLKGHFYIIQGNEADAVWSWVD